MEIGFGFREQGGTPDPYQEFPVVPPPVWGPLDHHAITSFTCCITYNYAYIDLTVTRYSLSTASPDCQVQVEHDVPRSGVAFYFSFKSFEKVELERE